MEPRQQVEVDGAGRGHRDRDHLGLLHPAVHARRPTRSTRTSSWKFVNYAPILTGGALLALWIGWHLSAKKWFTGPKMTIDLPEGVTGADEIALEHQGKTAHGGETHDWKPGDPLA